MVKIHLTGTIERKHPTLPRYVVVPGELVSAWNLTGTAIVTGTLNGVPLGRRGFKAWDCNWFFEIPQPLCRKAGVDTGSTVEIELELAPGEFPEELQWLIDRIPAARAAWDSLTPSQQRMLREYVAVAKQSPARIRRARAGLGVPAVLGKASLRPAAKQGS